MRWSQRRAGILKKKTFFKLAVKNLISKKKKGAYPIPTPATLSASVDSPEPEEKIIPSEGIHFVRAFRSFVKILKDVHRGIGSNGHRLDQAGKPLNLGSWTLSSFPPFFFLGFVFSHGSVPFHWNQFIMFFLSPITGNHRNPAGI